MNEIKEEGVRLKALLDKVNEVNMQLQLQLDSGEGRDLVAEAEAYRWTAIAKTDLQTGLMALTRAVAKPAFL